MQNKQPLPIDVVQKVAEYYGTKNYLAHIGFLFIPLVGYASLFRMNEIQSIALKDIVIRDEYMSVHVPKRKIDQYREGHTSLLARSRKATCPVSIAERFIKLLPQPSSCHRS